MHKKHDTAQHVITKSSTQNKGICTNKNRVVFPRRSYTALKMYSTLTVNRVDKSQKHNVEQRKGVNED